MAVPDQPNDTGARPGAGPPGVHSTVAQRLSWAGCLAADEEAGEMLADGPDAATLEARIRRREQGEPLAWITGFQMFCGRRVRVGHGVYEPRPQSEELARRAAGVLAATGGPAADLCTGSGAVAHHLMVVAPKVAVVATDLDARAVACAQSNGVLTVQADLADPFRDGAFRLVTAVAPYVPTAALGLLPPDVRRYEPRPALDGGRDGLEIVRRVITSAQRVLRPGGWLFLEIGGDQGPEAASILASSGWSDISTWTDEERDLRGLSARSG
jgi:release factor glutamine methyltransferase